jgi:SAM-dependent methyltransferase
MHIFPLQIPILSRFFEKHFTYEFLYSYLTFKHELNISEKKKVKAHLDKCKNCWKIWNKVRWDKAMSTQGVAELKEYLGNDFVPYYDSSFALAGEWYRISPKTELEIKAFYKETSNYIYNLVIWYESNDREDFATELTNLATNYNLKSFIDFGCGVGNDGLKLIENGYEVYFIDFECPSISFLRWRAKKRKLDVEIINIEKSLNLPDADAVFAIDVLEHIVNPLEVIEKISNKTRLFAHRSEFNYKAGGRHPFHLNFDEKKLDSLLTQKGFVKMPSNYLAVWYRDK